MGEHDCKREREDQTGVRFAVQGDGAGTVHLKRHVTSRFADRPYTINGLFKAEIIHRLEHCKKSDAIELGTMESVARLTHHRLRESIGYITSADADAHHLRQQA